MFKIRNDKLIGLEVSTSAGLIQFDAEGVGEIPTEESYEAILELENFFPVEVEEDPVETEVEVEEDSVETEVEDDKKEDKEKDKAKEKVKEKEEEKAPKKETAKAKSKK